MTTEHETDLAPEETVEADAQEAVVEATEPEEHAPAPKPWDQEVEDEAKLLGWKSPDEWKGDKPPGYIDNPHDYMERVSKSTPFRKMAERAERAEEAARKTEYALRQAHKRDLERREQEYQRNLEYLTAQQRQATESADIDAFDRIAEQRKRLEAARDRELRQPQQADDPRPPEVIEAVDRYRAENPWTGDARAWAMAAKIIDDTPGAVMLSATEQLALAERRVKDLRPDLFPAPKPNPTPPPRVDGGGIAPSVKKKTGFDTLPKAARDAFAREVKAGTFEDNAQDREYFFDAYTNG